MVECQLPKLNVAGSTPVSRSIFAMRISCIYWKSALVLSLACLSATPLRARGASTNLFFAEGRIVCEISSRHEAIPELVLATLPIAMNAALEAVGTPSGSVRLAIRLQEPPSFYKRAKALFRVEAYAIQESDEIRLHASNDPLKLAFRLGHELSHWLVYKRHPARPPLWLDEGLAQMVGATAADTAARVHKQEVERSQPPKLEGNLFRLDELTALRAYPRSEARSAAFYWQAEAFVRAIHKRLGPTDFVAYLGLLCGSETLAWQVPLRERWYFSDWDINWLAEQIRKQSP